MREAKRVTEAWRTDYVMRAGLTGLSVIARRRNSLLSPARVPAARAMGCLRLSINPVPVRAVPHAHSPTFDKTARRPKRPLHIKTELPNPEV